MEYETKGEDERLFLLGKIGNNSSVRIMHTPTVWLIVKLVFTIGAGRIYRRFCAVITQYHERTICVQVSEMMTSMILLVYF